MLQQNKICFMSDKKNTNNYMYQIVLLSKISFVYLV